MNLTKGRVFLRGLKQKGVELLIVGENSEQIISFPSISILCYSEMCLSTLQFSPYLIMI